MKVILTFPNLFIKLKYKSNQKAISIHSSIANEEL